MIAEIQPGNARSASALDLDGDYVIPGIIDLHTDNLERQVQPRTQARWPSASALIAHDQQCAAAGITTVLDAFCLGDLGFEKDRVRTFREGMADIERLSDTGLMRAEHFLHLRCEVPADDMPGLLEPVAGHPLVRLASLMDHTPGNGQYADLNVYREVRLSSGTPEHELDDRIAELQQNRTRLRDTNRRFALAQFAGRGVPIASHDDRTPEEVAQNAADGLSISEFPLTMEAAGQAKAMGMGVIAGAPNVVRGGSHNKNVSAGALIEAGFVDALASDYVPTSLIESIATCVRNGVPMHRAVALVTRGPAQMVHLSDRGSLEPGLRADLVRLRLAQGLAVARASWAAGERIA
jgi:alpha-D-ribose 1-methylphosphonate 5-triphosphate diphosphatase